MLVAVRIGGGQLMVDVLSGRKRGEPEQERDEDDHQRGTQC